MKIVDFYISLSATLNHRDACVRLLWYSATCLFWLMEWIQEFSAGGLGRCIYDISSSNCIVVFILCTIGRIPMHVVPFFSWWPWMVSTRNLCQQVMLIESISWALDWQFVFTYNLHCLERNILNLVGVINLLAFDAYVLCFMCDLFFTFLHLWYCQLHCKLLLYCLYLYF